MGAPPSPSAVSLSLCLTCHSGQTHTPCQVTERSPQTTSFGRTLFAIPVHHLSQCSLSKTVSCWLRSFILSSNSLQMCLSPLSLCIYGRGSPERLRVGLHHPLLVLSAGLGCFLCDCPLESSSCEDFPL